MRHVGLILIAVAVAGLMTGARGGQLYVVPLAGGEPRRVSLDDGRFYGSPSWSPDGEQIACDTWPATGNHLQAQIGVLPAEGGATTLLGPGAMPGWSPDGRQIVCHAYAPQQIVVMNADGSGREALLNQWGAPRWSPDGASIVSLLNGGLARYDLATGKQRAIVSTLRLRPGFDYHAATDRFVAPTLRPSIVILERDESGGWSTRHRLAAGTRVGHTSWSPDGRRIVFAIGDINTYCRLAVIDTDGEAPAQMLPGLPVQWVCCNPRWSPDGERVAFIRMDADPEPPR